MGGFYRLKQALDEIAQMSFDPSRPDPGQREKTNLHFYFHILCCLKSFI